MGTQKVSPAQRLLNFANMTRKYVQMLPSQSFAENSTLSFQIPKARFLSKITLIVKGTFKLAHGSKTTYTASNFNKHNLLKRVRLTINNGFNPFDISGNMLSLYNIINKYNQADADTFGLDARTTTSSVSSGGATNTVSMVYELPITLNDKDLIGMLMLQNDQSIVTLNVDCSTILSVMTDTDITSSAISITVTPVLETFSIPLIPDAIPDYSIVKLVNEQSENIVNTNEMIVKVPTGLTYRKFGLYLASDTIYTPIPHANISYFKIQMNQADTPVNIPADMVAYQNKIDYDGGLPLGCYVFDFATQGIANYGSGRDYIDTERLQEFWVTIGFSGLSGATNYVYLFKEMLAKLV
jgi:hypothetical protein